jgi:hypothetical protein
MKPGPVLWLLLAVLILFPTAFWLTWRRHPRRGGWKHEKETVPGLGQVGATYQKGELLCYDCEKYGVNLQINCHNPGKRASAVKAAQGIIQPDIESHLQRAIQAIPEEQMKLWGFAQGKWTLETLFINGENDFVLELGNSHNPDHCCRVIVEGGKYEFETVDG